MMFTERRLPEVLRVCVSQVGVGMGGRRGSDSRRIGGTLMGHLGAEDGNGREKSRTTNSLIELLLYSLGYAGFLDSRDI